MGESEEGEKKKKKKKKREGWNGGQPGGVMCDLCMAGAWHKVASIINYPSMPRSALKRTRNEAGWQCLYTVCTPYEHTRSLLQCTEYSSCSLLVMASYSLSRVLHTHCIQKSTASVILCEGSQE